MNVAKIPCWIETHRRMKWRLPMRIASLPQESNKAAKRNPSLRTEVKTNRAVGRPRKWEDDNNDFLRPEETAATNGNDVKNNDTWTGEAKKQAKWKKKENKFAAAGKRSNIVAAQ